MTADCMDVEAIVPVGINGDVVTWEVGATGETGVLIEVVVVGEVVVSVVGETGEVGTTGVI